MRHKILYLSFHPEIGGGETILLSLISKINKKLFEPIVVVTKKGQMSEELKRLKIKTYILPLPGYLIRTLFIPGMSPLGIYRFYRLCKKIKPDLIHLNHLNLAIYAGISSKILKIPTVATSHGIWDSIYFFQDLINTIFVDHIMAITKEVKEKLTKRNILKWEKISLISLGIDTDVFKPGSKNLAKKKLNLPLKDVIITIVGRIDPIKDHITFLGASKIVMTKIKNVKFIIVGSELGNFTDKKNLYSKQIKDFLKNNPHLSKNVIFPGFIRDMATVYRATDISVSSSLSESFSLAIAEAASSSVPVIATKSNKQSYIIKNGITGYLVPPKKPNLMAGKIILLAKNQSLRNSFGEKARNNILKNFTLKAYVKNIEFTYLHELKANQNPTKS